MIELRTNIPHGAKDTLLFPYGVTQLSMPTFACFVCSKDAHEIVSLGCGKGIIFPVVMVT